MSGHFTDLNHAVLRLSILEKDLIMIRYKKRRGVTKLTYIDKIVVNGLLGNVGKIGPFREKYTLFWKDREK